jgi:hypothetical protein
VHDVYVGAHNRVYDRRSGTPFVLASQRHPRRSFIRWSGIRDAHALAHRNAWLPSAAAGGRPSIEKVDVEEIAGVSEFLLAVWAWAAFEIVKNLDDPPEAWWWRVYCTAIANPGLGIRIARLDEGSVYLLLEPTPGQSGAESFQVFEVRWTRLKDTRSRRRGLVADPWKGRFLQNEDRQRGES